MSLRCHDSHNSNTNILHEKLQELYQSTSWTVNTCESYEMDQMLKALRSPAHQSFFVLQHAIKNHDLSSMDSALSCCRHLLKPDYCFLLLVRDEDHDSFKGISAQTSGKSPKNKWLLPGVLYNAIKKQTEIPLGWKLLGDGNNNDKNSQSSKKFVDEIISIANTQSLTNFNPNRHNLEETENGPLFDKLQSLYAHLWYTLGTDLRNGAAAADVAFSLSLVGIQGTLASDLFDILAHIAALELERKSTRSRRASDILQIVEKLAASGVQGEYADKAYKTAARSLDGAKDCEQISTLVLKELECGKLKVWSTRPLIWLWRRMSLFHKVSTKDLASSLSCETLLSSNAAISPVFQNPHLPLVIDVGCGLGVPLLALAAQKTLTTQQQQATTYQLNGLVDWTNCNYMGAELSSHAVRWATAMASRHNLMHRLQFLHISTESILDYLLQQEQCVSLILLQFPTPYRLQGDGNSRLPTSSSDDTFMANPSILQRMVDLLKLSHKQQGRGTYLMVQSNCEDVAIYIHNTLNSMGLHSVKSTTPRTLKMLTDAESSGRISERTKSWLKESETLVHRAAGEDWSSQPILPFATETEAACEWQGTAIHRCLFQTTTEEMPVPH